MKFTIPGKPQGKERPRFNGHHAYTPRKTLEYEKKVGWYYTSSCKEFFTTGVKMRITAHFKIPKSRKELRKGMYHLQKPDGDNIFKGVADSLNGLAYKDDSQVCHVEIVKVWDDEDYVEVEIESLKEPYYNIK